jgi:O6-methylguanine-DNA--protein-cysteine methyltransferase
MACGGGSSGSVPVASAIPVSTTITGTAVKGPVEGATVTIKKASDGTVLGTTTTTAGGAYTLAVAYSGDVIVEVNGGTYLDEATQIKTALSAPMKAVLNANGSNVIGVVTPITTMAYTNAFSSAATPVTAAAFKTQATSLADQFKLSGVDLTTTAPLVTGTTNDYGKALASLSKYMQLNNVTLNSLVSQAYKDAQFSTGYSAAYNTVVPGSNVTYTFSNGTSTTTVVGGGAAGSDLTVSTNGGNATVTGTGAGGGTGTCGVNAKGTVNQPVQGQNISVPIDINVCVTGIATGSCSASNASLSQTVAGAQGLSGAVNLTYTYTAACAAGAFTVALK